MHTFGVWSRISARIDRQRISENRKLCFCHQGKQHISSKYFVEVVCMKENTRLFSIRSSRIARTIRGNTELLTSFGVLRAKDVKYASEQTYEGRRPTTHYSGVPHRRRLSQKSKCDTARKALAHQRSHFGRQQSTQQCSFATHSRDIPHLSDLECIRYIRRQARHHFHQVHSTAQRFRLSRSPWKHLHEMVQMRQWLQHKSSNKHIENDILLLSVLFGPIEKVSHVYWILNKCHMV